MLITEIQYNINKIINKNNWFEYSSAGGGSFFQIKIIITD